MLHYEKNGAGINLIEIFTDWSITTVLMDRLLCHAPKRNELTGKLNSILDYNEK